MWKKLKRSGGDGLQGAMRPHMYDVFVVGVDMKVGWKVDPTRA